MTNHYIDAPDDSLLTTNEMVNRDELSSMYRDAKKEDLGPWMTEAQRQQVLQDKRDAQVIGLRRHAVSMGLLMSLPYIAGMLLLQFALHYYATYEKPTAMFFFFVNMFLLAGYGIGTVMVLKYTSRIFRSHTLKSSPIAITILGILFLVTQPLFHLAGILIGGVVGYVAAVIMLSIISIILAVIMIYVWTSPKIARVVKAALLLVCFLVALALHYSA